MSGEDGYFDPDDYVKVHERVAKFRADHPTWSLLSEILGADDRRVTLRAWVIDDKGITVCTGHAEETRKPFALEKAETSAWGRALAALGYEVSRSIASAEEMARVTELKKKRTPRRSGGDSAEGGGGPAAAAHEDAGPPPLRAELRRRLNNLAAVDRASMREWWFERSGQKLMDLNVIGENHLETIAEELDGRGW